MATDIMDYFPYDEPRPSQLRVLRWIEENWDKYDVFVLQCPVAAGKSALAWTIARWAYDNKYNTINITTPDNVLVNQYKGDFDELEVPPSRKQFINRDSFLDAKDVYLENNPIRLMNNYTLLANRMYAELQIFDEAHELIPMLQDFEGIKWYPHLVRDALDPAMFKNFRTVAQLLVYFQSVATAKLDINPNYIKQAKKVVKSLGRNPEDFVVNWEQVGYRGNLVDCLRVYPLTPKGNRPILWPPTKVRKMILMSATIDSPDVYDLGLDKRRVGYIAVPSDIPKENRPIVYAGVGSMGRLAKAKTIPKIQSTLEMLHDRHNGRGFIHCTYEVAARLNLDTDKFIVHNKLNSRRLYNDWRDNINDRRTFIGCGFSTGINLKGSDYRWQAIVKCQFPDLGDPAVLGKSSKKPEWYAWATIKTLAQSYGRICRGPEDQGTTYVLDSDFIKLYSKWTWLFPSWFRESITMEKL